MFLRLHTGRTDALAVVSKSVKIRFLLLISKRSERSTLGYFQVSAGKERIKARQQPAAAKPPARSESSPDGQMEGVESRSLLIGS